jgi:hypothetical protein
MGSVISIHCCFDWVSKEYFNVLQSSSSVMRQKPIPVDEENLRDGLKHVETDGEESFRRSSRDGIEEEEEEEEEEEMVFDDAFLDECVQPSSGSDEEDRGGNSGFLMNDPVVQMMSKRVSELEVEYAKLNKN